MPPRDGVDTGEQRAKIVAAQLGREDADHFAHRSHWMLLRAGFKKQISFTDSRYADPLDAVQHQVVYNNESFFDNVSHLFRYQGKLFLIN